MPDSRGPKKDRVLNLKQHLCLRRTFVVNVSLCLASILVVAFGAEGIIRAARSDTSPRRNTYPQGLYCKRHPLLGWIGIPHATGTVSWASDDMDDMHVTMNGEGFWDSDHQEKKPDGTKRILFLGDSFTIGYGVRYEDRFSELISRKLPFGTEVINMGMWGYSTDQELLLYSEIGQKFDPDILVLSMFLDDLFCTHLVSVNQGRYIKPKFTVTGDGVLELENTPVPDNNGSSVLLNMIRSRIGVIKNRLNVGREFAERNWFSVFDKAYVRGIGYYLSLRIVDELHAMAKEKGMPFLLVLIPYKDQLMEKEIHAQNEGYVGIPPHRLDLRLPQKVVTHYCQKKGIPVLDLLPVFQEESQRTKLFFDRDLHWTKEGHQVAAHAILERLKSTETI
jgi:hypothetical protein